MDNEKIYIDLSGLERQIGRVFAATDRVEDDLSSVNKKLNQMSGEIEDLSREMKELKSIFENFVESSKRAMALQKAATELVRVRQELEQNFGNYKIVRETILGVLQATDAALVKRTTIANVSEELMLSTPDYWLAPCLVAVAAWIDNDRALANRAIREAVKRDAEKTALTMALICRRNNRTEACFEWLSMYFAKQSALHFTESNFTYLNAYLNGVFGSDDRHICEDYVAKWLREIQGDGEVFAQEQTDRWCEYYKGFTVDLEGQFPRMRSDVPEYEDIAAYISRIESVDKISGNFSEMKSGVANKENLKCDIDQTLVSLVSSCDAVEEPLRREEKYLMAVRFFDGNIEAAKRAVLEADQKRTEKTVDLVSQMTNILTERKNARPSEKKTSLNFLSPYIRSGFRKYLEEKKPKFPRKITLKVDSWSGVFANDNDAETLHREYEAHMHQECQKNTAKYEAIAPKPFWITGGILGAMGLMALFANHTVGMILLMLAAVIFMIPPIGNEVYKNLRNNIIRKYDAMIAEGDKRIDEILAEWKKAKRIVNKFETAEIPDIVA